MNKKIVVKDAFNISDKKNSSPVKGVVVMRDEEGHIIFKKNNLVVYSGRKLIGFLFARMIGANENQFSNMPTYDNPYNVKLLLGTNTSATLDSNNLNTFTDVHEMTIDPSQYNLTATEDDIYVKFTFSIAGSGLNAINMSELGLKLVLPTAIQSNTTNQLDLEKEFLFSRIVFDPMPFTSGTTYTLEYYLYF